MFGGLSFSGSLYTHVERGVLYIPVGEDATRTRTET